MCMRSKRRIEKPRMADLLNGSATSKKVDPGNRDTTLAKLLERYPAARTDIAGSTRIGEKGRIAKFRSGPLFGDFLLRQTGGFA